LIGLPASVAWNINRPPKPRVEGRPAWFKTVSVHMATIFSGCSGFAGSRKSQGMRLLMSKLEQPAKAATNSNTELR